MNPTFSLHPDDEAILVATDAAGTRREYRINPTPNGEIFTVTLPGGEEHTLGRRTQLWGTLWSAGSRGTLREFHKSDNRPAEQTGDCRAILAVLAWYEARRAARAAGRTITGIEALATRIAAQGRQMTRMAAPDPSPLAGFCARHGGTRIGR